MADVRTEPSMEEILASIKRIIADDGLAAGGSRPRPRADAPEPTPPETVLELTDAVASPKAGVSVPDTAPAESAAPVAPAPVPAPAPVAAPAPAATPAGLASPPPVEPGATLVSEDAASASRQSLSALSAVARVPAGDMTVDGLVRESLRPMLKEWLDAHLPEIVESLVAREIARITGKAR